MMRRLLVTAWLAGCGPTTESLQPQTSEVPTPEAPPPATAVEPAPAVAPAPAPAVRRPKVPPPVPVDPAAPVGTVLVVSTGFTEVAFRGSVQALPAVIEGVPSGRHEIRGRTADGGWHDLSVDVTIQPDANRTVVTVEP